MSATQHQERETAFDGGQKASRRSFMGKLLSAWSALALAAVVKGIAEYVVPRPSTEGVRESLRVAAVSDIAIDTGKVVRFNKEPVIVVHTHSGQFKAFSARCTHLGCIVKFEPDKGAPHFSCACHGSQFDINGKNIAGPAPSPLRPMKVAVQDENLIVSRV